MLMRERHLRGAFCLVAALKRDATTGYNEDRTGERERGEAVTDDVSTARYVVGTLECSRHEFDGTPLAVETEGEAGRIARCGMTMFLDILIQYLHFTSFRQFQTLFFFRDADWPVHIVRFG